MRNSYNKCKMRFWYQINGRNIGFIDTFITVGGQRSRALRLSDVTYEQWLEGVVYIAAYKTGFSVSIEANRSYSVVGNIAVDDISFHDCGVPEVRNCTFGESKCPNGVCIETPTRYCDLTDDCGDNSDEDPGRCVSYPFKCDFESGVCQWTPDATNKYNWERARAGDVTSAVATRRDHSINAESGAYLYFDTKGSRAV